MYGHFKASISDTLHRTLIWSSAQTIELAVCASGVGLLASSNAYSAQSTVDLMGVSYLPIYFVPTSVAPSATIRSPCDTMGNSK